MKSIVLATNSQKKSPCAWKLPLSPLQCS